MKYILYINAGFGTSHDSIEALIKFLGHYCGVNPWEQPSETFTVIESE